MTTRTFEVSKLEDDGSWTPSWITEVLLKCINCDRVWWQEHGQPTQICSCQYRYRKLHS